MKIEQLKELMNHYNNEIDRVNKEIEKRNIETKFIPNIQYELYMLYGKQLGLSRVMELMKND